MIYVIQLNKRRSCCYFTGNSRLFSLWNKLIWCVLNLGECGSLQWLECRKALKIGPILDVGLAANNTFPQLLINYGCVRGSIQYRCTARQTCSMLLGQFLKGLRFHHSSYTPTSYLIMLWMHNPPSVKCHNGHDAYKLCIKPSCAQSAPICKEKGCEYFLEHKRCAMSSDIEDVIQLLIEKGMKYSVIDEEVIKCYDQIIKLVEMERQEYKKLIKEPGARLRGNEGTLFRLLNGGQGKDIKPGAVNRVIERLAENEDIQIQQLKSEVFELGNKVMQAVQKILDGMSQVWGHSKDETAISNEEMGFSFSSELCCGGRIQVLNNGKQIKHMLSKQAGFALVSPAVSKKRRINIKILKDEGGMYLGLAHKQQMTESAYGWPKNNQGVYVVFGYNGWVYNVLDPEKHLKNTSFRFSTGDVVEMEYDPCSRSLRLQNKNKNLFHSLKNIEQIRGNPLHFCVDTYNKDEQVQILEED